MKTRKNVFFIVATACALTLFVSFSASAVENQTHQWGTYKDKVDRKAQTVKNRHYNMSLTRPIRASELIGMDVENTKGKTIANVDDIVIDANSGEIRYVAVTYGGFMGLGNKLFAVPMEAFSYKSDPKDPDDHILTLDVSKETLKGAAGFDKDKLPNFADQKFTNSLDKQYNVDRMEE